LEDPLAHSKSALKRWRQNERHRERNKAVRSAARTAVRTARTAIADAPDGATQAIAGAASILDRATKSNVIHKNAAARHKSRLMRHQHQALSGTAPTPVKKTAAKKTTAKKAAAKKTATKRTAAKKTAS
jgi:small subunit ribosomal protein S20